MHVSSCPGTKIAAKSPLNAASRTPLILPTPHFSHTDIRHCWESLLTYFTYGKLLLMFVLSYTQERLAYTSFVFLPLTVLIDLSILPSLSPNNSPLTSDPTLTVQRYG